MLECGKSFSYVARILHVIRQVVGKLLAIGGPNLINQEWSSRENLLDIARKLVSKAIARRNGLVSSLSLLRL